jgi:similar to stage IV sporulation protein
MSSRGLGDYFNGYIMVKVESLNPEKVLNQCLSQGIVLRDIERKNYTTIIFKMKHKQYKILKKALHNTNSKTKIIRKYGLHFAYISFNRRRFFLLGSVVFFGLLIIFSSFIWNIDISGNKKIDSKEISTALKKAGLKVGIVKYNINLRKIEEEVIKEIKEVSVIKINFYGTKAYVDIVERTMPPKIIDKNSPANIIARKEGIITNIHAYKGVSLVKKGDLVKPNQVLISGLLSDTENELNTPTHALGLVSAKTWYEARKDINLDYKYEVRSGKYKTKIYYLIGNHKLNIKNSNINFKKYDKIENRSKIKIFGVNTTAIKVTEYYYEKIDAYKKLSYTEALNIGMKEANEMIKKLVPDGAKVMDIKSYKTKNKKNVSIRVLYILEENIGIEKEIG